MNENQLISIIIPVYNVEKYLKECLDSVTNQTYKNLEIILIDDGSTDSSGEICDEFIKKDNRIRVIHKQNGGLSSARNAGLDIMQGEYLAFVDSDDIIDESYIQTLFDMIQKYNTKISMIGFCKFKNIKELDEYKNQNSNSKDFVLSSHDIFKLSFLPYNAFMTTAWTNLYNKEIFKNLRFREGILFEDTDIYFEIIETYNSSKSVAFCDKKLYFYRQQEDSIMKKFNEKKLSKIEIANKFADKIVEKYSDLKKYANFYKCNIALFLYTEIILQNDYKKYNEKLKESCQIVKQNFDFIFAYKINLKRAILLQLFKINPKLYNFIYKVFKK